MNTNHLVDEIGDTRMIKTVLAFLLLVSSHVLTGQIMILEDTLTTYLNEVRDATSSNKELWGLDLYSPILFVDAKTRIAYANEADSAGILVKGIALYKGTLPKSINIANTAIKWSGKRWAMIILPLPENKNERLNLITHELFHRAQSSLNFILYNIDNNHLDKKEGRIYLRLELEALRKAILTHSAKDMRAHITNALIFRKRRNEIFPKSDSAENMLELNEGIAEYTGLVLSGRNKEQLTSHIDKSMTQFLTNKTFVRSFAYQTTPIYGYLLSTNSRKYWNKDVTVKTKLAAHFQTAFAIKLTPDQKVKSESISKFYNGDQIIREEELREVANIKLINEQLSKFVTNPHFEIPFENMNVSFDPRNIISLEGHGTVYPTIRVTDNWGILTVEDGALMSANWNKITVTKPLELNPKIIKGDGWVLEIKSDLYTIRKDLFTDIYYLTKK